LGQKRLSDRSTPKSASRVRADIPDRIGYHTRALRLATEGAPREHMEARQATAGLAAMDHRVAQSPRRTHPYRRERQSEAKPSLSESWQGESLDQRPSAVGHIPLLIWRYRPANPQRPASSPRRHGRTNRHGCPGETVRSASAGWRHGRPAGPFPPGSLHPARRAG
jgi:hypothetical protein